MFQKFLDSLPSASISLLITMITTLIIFSGAFSTLQTKVDAFADTSKNAANKQDVDKFNSLLLNRIESIDRKIDDIYKILINRK